MSQALRSPRRSTRSAPLPGERVPHAGAAQRAPQTQEGRSAHTQSVILDATLRCLREIGYRKTTLAQIQAVAGVSRGALLHHFRTKVDLVAAAMVRFYADRLERHRASMAALPADSDLRDRLKLMRDELRTHLPVTAEFNLAMRSDADLRAAFEAAMSSSMASAKDGYARLLPEFADDADGPWILQVIGCFHRGLAMEGLVKDEATIERISGQFATLLERTVSARTKGTKR